VCECAFVYVCACVCVCDCMHFAAGPEEASAGAGGDVQGVLRKGAAPLQRLV